MKKLLIVLCALIFLAGCSLNQKDGDKNEQNNKPEEVVKPDEKSVIDCSLTSDTTKVRFYMNYNDTKTIVEDGQLYMDLIFENQLTDEQFKAIKSQDFCSMTIKDLNEKVEIYSNCKQTIEGKVVKLTFDIDLSKLEEFENGLFKATMSKDQVIKYFERQSAVCEK